TKKPTIVPISTRKPKSQANKSVATPNKKKVASKPTNQKPQSYFWVLYENTSKEWKWWIERQSPSGYKWVPKPKKQWVPKEKMQWVPKAKNDQVHKRIVQLILFIVDSGCTKHMTGNLTLLYNCVEMFLGTVRFGNDQFAPILGYGDLVQGNVTINRVYYVKGLNYNLFSVGQFCDADLEVAFRKSTYFVRDLQGNDLLTGLIPQRQKASDYDNPDPVPQRQDVYSLVDADVPSQQELDLLFGPLYDEFFNAGSTPSTNIQSTSAPSTHTNVHAEENNNDQAEKGEHLQDDEFTNPFCTPAQEDVESSSHNLGNTNVPTFNQPQLATDPEMCMYALTVSTAEPKNIKEAMADSAWIEAMQEELHQFDKLQVWELVDKPFGKSIIRLKWLWKNKKDEDQTVIRNKARLVAKGYAQEEGLQIHQSPSGIFINHAKYTLEILHKHGMDKGQSIGTPMTTKPKLDADLSGNPVDQTDYHSKIGSLMYLTSSRPDIMQAGSSFELTAFSNADHTGCIDSRKNTFGGIQLLGDKLVSWMSKKQNCTAMSSAEAEYVALSASYAQVMWMRTQLQDYGFNHNKIPLYCDS
nr:hypothetical protein [Tanacetum cinerariifolium]